MTSLPLDVHEVLEQEYEAIHGPLTNKPPATYRSEDITDPEWAKGCLLACGFGGDTLAALNALVEKGNDFANLERSPAITESGRKMLKMYTKGEIEQTPDNRRRIVDEALNGAVRRIRDVRLEAFYETLHKKEPNDARTALCISGGGIRSATFALGVIQGLAGTGILEKFDYLSTVSGGGYIGSWLSSWSRRHKDGIKGVQDDLVRADTGRLAAGGAAKRPDEKIDPQPEPLRHLRAYSNYLSPKLGFLSADSWTLAALYIRNLLLNLLVLVPVLAGVLALPRFYEWLLRSGLVLDLNALGIITAAMLAVGFGYLGAARPVRHGRESKAWKINTNPWFVWGCIAPLTVAGFCISVFWAQNAGAILGGTYPLTASAELWALICALVMVLVPCVVYYVRFAGASFAERRQSATRASGKQTFLKVAYEGLGALVGLGTAVGLFWLLGKKLFPTPIMKVPDPNAVDVWRRSLVPLPAQELYICFALPLVLLVFFVQASIFVGISSRWNEDNDREWWGRAGAYLLIAAVLIGGLSFIAVFGPVLLYRAPLILGSIGGASGIAAALVGRSSKTPADDKKKSSGGSSIVGALAVPLFAVVLLAAISLGTTELILAIKERPKDVEKFTREKIESQFTATVTSVNAGIDYEQKNEAKMPAASVEVARSIRHLKFVQGTRGDEVLAIILVAIGAAILSTFVGVNRFSMQGLYRNRIIRAYLGASRYSRDPDRFTGFDENDNLQMYELRQQLLWTTSFDDPCAFIEQIARNSSKPGVEKTIWDNLDGSVRKKIEETLRKKEAFKSSLIAGVVQSVNVQMQTVDLVTGKADGSPVLMLKQNRLTLEDRFPMLKKLGNRRTPFHVVNTALNVVSGDNLAWQQRMAESFTASPLHCGSLYLGYRDSREYGGDDGISLGTAVAISGAAASPNQGYHSSLPLAFIMTLLNVRLGGWLGNPGLHGSHSYTKSSPYGNLNTLLWEMTGNTNDRCPWIYLSDGGHFENLALYEMVLRRCRYIVLSDGGCDPSMNFEDFGNAIRKIRTDLGVPIEIKSRDMLPRPAPGEPLQSGSYMAIASIRYSAIDKDIAPGKPAPDGVLVYIKPSVYNEDFLPRDVYNYMQSSPEFPHESTSDQFFSESQFESYRALGRHVIDVICGKSAKYSTVAEFAQDVKTTADGMVRSEHDNTLKGIALAIRELPKLLPKSP
ncbi:MAG TPA: patatin-like phospholipase family protein [Thermoanaerobaculia bacterium]|nr:patatin-like phospholipase family protein [Thermoanaerobaculia bacterium]